MIINPRKLVYLVQEIVEITLVYLKILENYLSRWENVEN
jgi:hypothetical protein